MSYITRRILRTTEANEKSVAAPITWFAGEGVLIGINSEWFNVAQLTESGLTPKLFAWAAADPSQLYVDKAGIVSNATALFALTPAESNLTPGEYVWQVQVFNAGNVLMGVAAQGTMTVVYAVPQPGLPTVGTVAAYPTTLPGLTDVDSDMAPTNGQLLGYNTANLRWEAVNPGAGSGDFVGTASSVTDNLLSFLDETGKAGKDSGIAAADVVTAAEAFGAAERVLFSAGNDKTAKSRDIIIFDVNAGTLDFDNLGSVNFQLADEFLVDAGGGITIQSATVVQIAGASITANGVALRPDITHTLTAGDFDGILPAELVGWARRDIDSAATTLLFAGALTADTTQRSGTFSSTFAIPTNATAWATAAFRFMLIADDTASGNCKYDVEIVQMDANLLNGATIYSTTNNTFGSTTAPTILPIADSALSAAIVAGGFVTVRIILHSANGHGSYIGTVKAGFKQ